MDFPSNSSSDSSSASGGATRGKESFSSYPTPNPGAMGLAATGSYPAMNTGWQPTHQVANETADIAAAIWRYRWAVLIPTILGLVAGFLVFLKTPETFQSATRLMFESDRPAVMDNLTGDLVGGVPTIEILRSQLFSDTVLNSTYQHEKLRSFHEEFDNNPMVFAGLANKCLEFETDLQDLRGASSIVANMTFEHTDPELCEAAIQAFSASFQKFFADRHKSSRSELMNLISVATDQLQPKLTELEERYREFRTTAPLVWDENGAAINPHRERQLYLTGRRSELFEQLRQKSIELSAIQSIADEDTDPIVRLSIIGQLIGKTFEVPGKSIINQNMREGDEELAQIQLDRQLVPLMIERNKFAAEFGDQHPTVKALDAELSMMKSELKRLVKEQSERIVELMEENKVEGVDPAKRAMESVNVILTASNAEVELLKHQISEIDSQIATEKAEAVKLAKFEQDNTSLLREIDRNRELINQLEEQMARVELTEEDGGLRLTELRAPTRAYRVGPNMLLMLGIGIGAGILLGCGLALLLEKNANTFREPEEIVAAVGAPILTHVPFFKGRVRRKKGEQSNPFEHLDSHLAVVHAPSSVASEAIRSCRTSVLFELAGIQGGKVLQVTSPLPGDGKSTIAGNLACSIAQSGKRTLIIDCDLRRPQVTDNFAMADQLGLVDVLNGKCDHVDAAHPTPLRTLFMMPSGPIPANPAEALTLPEMSELLEALREEYDYIILDTPPLLVVTDPSITASMTDGVVMALKVRRKSKPNAKEAASILTNVGAKLLGVVINASDEGSNNDGYKGYGYYRYGRHTNRYYRKTAENGAKAGQRRTPVVVSGRSSGVKSARPIAVQAPVAAPPVEQDSSSDV
ncbi:polysaccharide biosynthesis tyrosine autokinase [Rhodopirellula halodulae]|uniref:polysaccharide biosynthesis tyrosine autokinase n=1 Tax=Rhodopirellula halodulae TaxID=2894198 RepID=UPI001E48FD1F|nr:polysaccharide biosynthesis tyrosine autokinase [Rhodopirellula sp. JC737]MCC9655660.1 polysaccharide biosynthesis tyrosine autokinase [Rhodopirellula sp. JC737]